MANLTETLDTADLRDQLRQTQRQLAKAKAKSDALAEAAVQAAKGAVLANWSRTPVKPPKLVKHAKQATAEHALLHVSDWQGAKITPSYNSQVMRERIKLYADKVEHLIGIYRAARDVPDCTLMLGGDMIEGLFNFPSQPFEIDATLFEQFVTVANTLSDLVRRLLATFDHVTVVAEWGNHGRLGSKRDAVPRNDNADRMTYELARQTLLASQNDGRLTWQDCPEDIQRVEIGNYRALLIHGDEIGRNGFASVTTIVQHINRWRSGAYPWEFRDVHGGHYHTNLELPLANGLGSYYQCGSTESDNRYAGVMLAGAATPSQRMHIVDPDAGRIVSSYKVWLDK